MPNEEPVSEATARAFCARIADPEQFSGGGAVAALTAASAAATALLVSRLADRRRRPAVAEQAHSTQQPLSDLVERFFDSADRDLAVLDQLLIAQRELRSDGNRTAYAAALRDAAEEPLRLAADIALLLEIVRNDLPRASRFTVSDLGAAASLARGAAQAALLTASVNVALLREESGMEVSAGELGSRIASLAAVIDALADDVVDVTLARIDGGGSVKQVNT